MAFDIKAKIEEAVQKLKDDPKLAEKFQKDPIKTIEAVLGVDLPNDQLQPLVAGIQAKLAASGLGEKLSGLKNLF